MVIKKKYTIISINVQMKHVKSVVVKDMKEPFAVMVYIITINCSCVDVMEKRLGGLEPN